MPRNNNKRDRKPDILRNLMDGGTVSSACKAVEVSRETFYKWYRQDEKFAKAVDDAQNSRIQHVEDSLYSAAVRGNVTAQIFFLCNRAKDKWVNVQNVKHEGTVTLRSLLTDKGVEE